MFRRVKWLPITAVIIGAASVAGGAAGLDAAATIPGGMFSITLAIMSKDTE